MDFLQAALIFLILLLSIFLAITGIQVFLILKDLKKALDRFNNMLKSGENIASEVEEPIIAAAQVANDIGEGAKAITGMAARAVGVTPKKEKSAKPKKRFYKRFL